MKQKSFWITIFLLGSLMVSGYVALGISSTPSAASNVLSDNLAVVPGDIIYFHWRNVSETYPRSMVIKYEILSVNNAENELTYKRYIAGMPDGFGGYDWSFVLQETKTESYTEQRVFGHQISLTNITNIADYTTELSDGFRDSFIVDTSVREESYVTEDGYHKVIFEADQNDNPTTPIRMVVWEKAATGIIEYMFQNSSWQGATVQELMKYEKAPGSKLPAFPIPDTYNFTVGDRLTVFSPNEMGGNRPNAGSQPQSAGDDPQFRTYTVSALYHNPVTTEDVIMVDISEYYQLDSTPAYTNIYREEGRIIRDDYDSQFMSHFSQPGVMMGMTEDQLRLKYEDYMGVTIAPADFDLDGDHLKFTYNHDGEYNVEIYGELLPYHGFPQIFWQKMYNGSTNYFEWHVEMTIDGPGVIDSDPMIGVHEGDTWSAWLTRDGGRREWYWSPEYHENYYDNKGIFAVEIEVTHIFGGNDSVMAVIGNIRQWESTHPSHVNEQIFAPLLIFDTDNPATFLTGAGYTRLNGPPLLLPLADWSMPSLKTQVLNFVESEDGGFGVETIRNKFTSNSMRFAWDEWNGSNKTRGMIMLETSSVTGIVTHLEVDQERREENPGYWGYENRERQRMFVYEAPSCASADPAAVTTVEAGDVLIWEHQSYRPYDSTIHKKSHDKMVIMDVVDACDGSIVFLGARYWKDAADPAYSGSYWELKINETLSYDINFWMLSSVRDNDLWSWMQGQIFDKGVTDFAPSTAIIAEMLNYAFPIPPGFEITSSMISASGRTFTVQLDFEEDGTMVHHIMKFAVNEEGLLQDMIQGSQNASTDEWRNWERTVLVNGPGAKGEAFTDTLPLYEEAEITTDTTDTTPTPPFIIPGYPTAIFLFIAVFAIGVLLRKRHV